VSLVSDAGTNPRAESSAVLVPVAEAEPLVAAYRRRLDPAGAWGVPAHVTLLFPFVPPTELDAGALVRLRAAVRSVAAFDCVFARTRWFGAEMLWLAPEPDEPFRRLTAAIWEAFPDYPPYAGTEPDPVPHLTVGGPVRDARGELPAAESGLRTRLPVHSRTDHALLMAGTREPDSWRVLHELPLGGS
jgi:2'-5' RNA ligase